MLDKLSASHRQLEASAARLSDLLEADAPDEEALKAARWEIGTRIMQHMAMEDRYLFANLAMDPRPHVAAMARRHQADFAGHVAAYAQHAKWWTAERVWEDWHGYRAMTRAMLRLLAERIRLVETELFPFAQTVPIHTAKPTGISWTREAFAIKDSVSPRT